MTASKQDVVAWMWRDINGDVQFNYMHPNGEPLIRLTDYERLQAETERLQAETERLQADNEAAIAELQADRDQQYDMKVKAREQRDVVTAENQRLRKALTRHVCTGMTDAQRTAELERYLSDGIAADKARIAELEKERDEWHRLFDSAGQLSKNACDDLNSAKSRIAELVLSLRTVVGMLHHRATTPLERQVIRIAETALAQQGEE